MDGELVELVDATVAALAPEQRSRCDAAVILERLDKQLGALTVADLQSMLTAEFTPVVVAALVGAAPFVFVTRLKAQLAATAAASPGFATPPTTAAAPPPPPAAAPASAPVAFMVTVKKGAAVVASARPIEVAPTEPFAILRSKALESLEPSLTEGICDLPATVALYRTPQHLSNTRASAELSDTVGASAALGYGHVVVAHTAPVAEPRAAQGNAFDTLMGNMRVPSELPDRYTCVEGQELDFELALFNALVDQAEAEAAQARHRRAQAAAQRALMACACGGAHARGGARTMEACTHGGVHTEARAHRGARRARADACARGAWRGAGGGRAWVLWGRERGIWPVQGTIMGACMGDHGMDQHRLGAKKL